MTLNYIEKSYEFQDDLESDFLEKNSEGLFVLSDTPSFLPIFSQYYWQSYQLNLGSRK